MKLEGRIIKERLGLTLKGPFLKKKQTKALEQPKEERVFARGCLALRGLWKKMGSLLERLWR